MAFSDYISSTRGPGAIGFILALLVLAGFGALATIALNDGPGKMSIHGVLREQARELEWTNDSITDARDQLDRSKSFKGTAQELSALKMKSKELEASIKILEEKSATLSQENVQQSEALESYKNSYRSLVRANAKGEAIPEIKTVDGVTYKGVVLREVTAVGIQITYEGGIKRIPFEMLPESFQERFQYDANQKEAALKKEQEQRSQHEQAVKESEELMAKQSQEQGVKAAENAKIANAKEYEDTKNLIVTKEQDIKNLEAAIVVEKQKKLSRAPGMEINLANKRKELSALKARLVQLKALIQ